MADRFTILDDGETLITGEWIPSPEDVSKRMLALADAYDNMLPPLIMSREAAIESTAFHFETQSDPHGEKWAPLDGYDEDGKHGGYAKQKVLDGYSADEILVRTGAGRDAALSESAWFIAEDALWFDMNTMPKYMDYHQSGTQGSGAAGEAALTRLFAGEKLTAEEHKAASSFDARGKNLPKREFIGFTLDDIAVFEDIWDSWFGMQLVEEFPVSSGGGNLGTNMLGQFPVIGMTKRGQPILRTPQGPRFGKL